jgi:hypothetical protein
VFLTFLVHLHASLLNFSTDSRYYLFKEAGFEVSAHRE